MTQLKIDSPKRNQFGFQVIYAIGGGVVSAFDDRNLLFLNEWILTGFLALPRQIVRRPSLRKR